MPTADNPPTYSRLLGWRIDCNEQPSPAKLELANRILTDGAPDLTHLLTLIDVRAAIDIRENHDAARVRGWRVDSGPPPEDLVDHAIARLQGKFPNRVGALFTGDYQWWTVLHEALKHGTVTQPHLTGRGIDVTEMARWEWE